MKLTIEANTIEELMEKVCAIANKFNVDLSENTQTIITPEVVKAVEEATVVEEKKEKKAKKEKTTTHFSESGEAATVKDSDIKKEESPKTYTKDDVTAACQKVSETFDLDKAREILAKFNAKRISEVKEADYEAFVKACEKEVKA